MTDVTFDRSHVAEQTSHSPARWVVMWVSVMMIATVAAFLLWRRDPRVTDENHIIESSQVGLLLVGCLVHSLRAHWKAHPLDTAIRVGLALLCLSFAVREVDIDKLGDALIWPTVEWGVRGVVMGAWIVFAVFLMPRMTLLRVHWPQVLCSACILLTVAGGVLYALSFPLDKQMLPLPVKASQFVEEVLQLNATILLFAAAMMPGVRRALS